MCRGFPVGYCDIFQMSAQADSRVGGEAIVSSVFVSRHRCISIMSKHRRCSESALCTTLLLHNCCFIQTAPLPFVQSRVRQQLLRCLKTRAVCLCKVSQMPSTLKLHETSLLICPHRSSRGRYWKAWALFLINLQWSLCQEEGCVVHAFIFF